MKLNAKQKAFAEHYAGNATEAAIKAGYSPKSADVTGARLLGNVRVQTAIKARENTESRLRIASRQQRQEFWTKTMENRRVSMKDRLKASELLGKSEGDFLERHDHTSSDGSMTPAPAIDLTHLTADELTGLAKTVFGGKPE